MVRRPQDRVGQVRLGQVRSAEVCPVQIAPVHVRMIVDQPYTIGALPVTVAHACGHDVAYLPGLSMRRVADMYPGQAKTDARDAFIIADTARTMPHTLRGSTSVTRPSPSSGCSSGSTMATLVRPPGSATASTACSPASTPPLNGHSVPEWRIRSSCKSCLA